MLPKQPPRSGQVGFLYIPPYRVQGISVAGEQTVVQVPELDVTFDIGLCPRIALSSPYVAISQQATQQIKHFLGEFGMTPASRSVNQDATSLTWEMSTNMS